MLTFPMKASAQEASDTSAIPAAEGITEKTKIDGLISYVENLQGATFIRNGSEHTPQDAAAHLRAKFDKHHAKIKSANEFIELLATKSSVSGEYYKIRLSDGSTTETYKLLHQELARIETEAGSK
ncbi:DUF5329 family protein [Pontibacter beigongshangensis]|uniref:DUF5329 family protein n=1 Tax=Pontibacter beigongshangensis TaxID=2574733 RepID=UPI00164F2A2C|nr:DUF5329 family protein [Pontibacter beigongshangensis]